MICWNQALEVLVFQDPVTSRKGRRSMYKVKEAVGLDHVTKSQRLVPIISYKNFKTQLIT